MITITIKGLSKEAHQALKKRAATHGRSLNTEAIAVLEVQRPQPAGGSQALIPAGAGSFAIRSSSRSRRRI